MIIVCADDEPLALKRLERCVREVCPEADIFSFSDGDAVAAFNRSTRCDVAFLDIEMPGKNGLALAKEMKEVNPDTNIIFVTAYEQYIRPAMRMHASGYIDKPVSAGDIRYEIEDLRKGVSEETPVKIQTFGNFEFFVRGRPVHFTRKKTKELLAYLVDRRGAMVTYAQLRAVLWEDETDNAEVRKRLANCINDLKNTLRKSGADFVLVKEGNSLGLDISRVSCDCYDYLNGDGRAVNLYRGEYMLQYSWAEFTLSRLEFGR